MQEKNMNSRILIIIKDDVTFDDSSFRYGC